MAEELQHLLKRIRTEAVEVSEEESQAILSTARTKADAIVKEAEEKAAETARKANRETQVLVDSGTRALEQAVRDLLITVGQGMERVVNEVAGAAVKEAYGVEFLQELIGKAITSYLADSDGTSGLEIAVSEQDRAAMESFIQSRFQKALAAGVTVRSDKTIHNGFRVSYDGSHAYHDFTGKAVTDSLAAMLRPKLAEIVHRVAREA